MNTDQIPYFATINHFLTAIQASHRTANDALFCLRVEDTFPHTVDVMPPFRKGFYFISFITDTGDTQIGYDDRQVSNLQTYLVFQSPGHLFSWHRDRTVRGYLIYFTKEAFQFFRPDFDDEFPFFNVLHTNFFNLQQDHFARFAPLLDEVFAAYRRWPLPTDPPIAALKLLAVLYECRAFVADLNRYEQRFSTPEQRTLKRFRELVGNFYLDKRTVEDYADLLNITPQYLSGLVKTATGQRPLHIISQKLVDEAKILLRYTANDISEVAYQLNFSDPANFGRFFKKHTQKTPLEYRRETALQN
ncbi:helix-turn-helix domain-containing protein [Spirosoma montaniterrae]|uniref:HTH araC/xylS-type domain-containing protein n=1 Tax=Spirosoma montaniterrae TaxID=1178516 RepID=A0A1P9X1N0_9BACT|nr:AraC family transcriptional regulator [Spirosoma montaniterrae]AQG81542.1 hypothetical protein AWR27_20825 [Spirosoma montaniterrae]